jgi:hypothetical protein
MDRDGFKKMQKKKPLHQGLLTSKLSAFLLYFFNNSFECLGMIHRKIG